MCLVPRSRCCARCPALVGHATRRVDFARTGPINNKTAPRQLHFGRNIKSASLFTINLNLSGGDKWTFNPRAAQDLPAV